jgi:asparagine synthase (glutamine-hydrolysing)
MCGICGYFNFNHKEVILAEQLRGMSEVLIHRGPHEYGYYEDVGLGLAFRGLQVPGFWVSQQPITNEDGTLALVCDGEIVNSKEIFEKLEDDHFIKSKDHREILLHFYEEKKERVLEEINGVFSLAIWDRKNQTLFCARDRAGQKPLYYAILNGNLVFASECKAIVRNFKEHTGLDLKSLTRYLAYGYVPPPDTLFTGIKQLPPAHYLQADSSGNLQIVRYWRPAFNSDKDMATANGEKEIIHHLYSLFGESVKRRFIEDSPSGIFLSGGIDSSSVVATVSSLYKGDDLHTYSVKFPEATYDESEYVDLITNQFHTNHKKVTITSRDALTLIPDIARLFEAPFSDPSIIVRYFLSKYARNDVTSIMTGDGGDELFAGYPTYQAHRLLQSTRFIPTGLLKFLVASVGKLASISDSNYSVNYTANMLFDGIGYEPEIANQIWLGCFKLKELTSLLSDNLGLVLTQESIYENLYRFLDESSLPKTAGIVERLQDYYFTFSFSQDLAKIERATMANSLQVRCPFLDKELMAYAFSLKPQLKVHRFTSKYIFKKAMMGKLPDSIINRSKKGLSVPVASWIKNDFREIILDVLSFDHIKNQGLFNPEFIERLVEEHLKGTRDNRKEIWTLFMFFLWYDEYCQ